PAAAAPPPAPAAEPAPVAKGAAVEKDLEDRARQDQPASGAVRRTGLANSHAKGGKGSLGSGAALRGSPADDLGASQGFAPPPPAMKPAKRVIAPEPEFAKKAAEAPAPDGFADTAVKRQRDEGPGRAGGGAPASSRAAAAPKMKTEAPAPAAASVAASAEEESASDSAGESPVARADRLFGQGRWADAARAYRELLRRDPHNADAARWRQRLAAAEAALAP
ncbi:MAG TPA: hypothetical protein VHG72_18685, partial [Polyangia bacterium]|nr:hypothetical protein [Polyangia bacterium]